jgi:hypothetical protein
VALVAVEITANPPQRFQVVIGYRLLVLHKGFDDPTVDLLLFDLALKIGMQIDRLTV